MKQCINTGSRLIRSRDLPIKLYLPKSFQREASREGIADEDCLEAIRKAETGLVDADLGKGFIKQRIRTGNRGAAKGSRAVVFYNRGKIAVFLHIFPKSKKANLTTSEMVMYARAAQELAQLSDKELTALSVERGWRELDL
jgi:hypothetical protein